MAVKDWWEDFFADDCLKIGSWENMTEHIQRSATLVVAAVNSDKTRGADYICDGVADQVQINQAIADLPEIVVVWDNCDSSAASWTRVQSDETLSDDNIDYVEGTGSLKCVGGTDNDPGVKKIGLGGLDWSSYNVIRFHLKQDAASECWLFFYDSSGNWERYDFNGRTVWHEYSISIGEHPDGVSAAALDWTDIVEIRIQIDTDTDAYTFRIDNIRLVDRVGGKVLLMEGDYCINDKITGTANTVLAGCGNNSNIFVANGTDVGTEIDGHHILFENCNNVTVKNLQVNFNGTNLGGIGDKHGIGFWRVYRGMMSNIYAHNLRLSGNVLSVIYSNAIEISQCYVENFDDYGIAIARCDDCSAHDNVVVGTSGDEIWGISITGGFAGDNWSFNCSILNNRVENIPAAILLRKAQKCNIIGNHCNKFSTKGIAVAGVRNAVISNNNINGNSIGWVGIQLYARVEAVTYDCESISVIGNTIQSCERVEANRARGILITDANYSIVNNNYIREIDNDNDGVGIETSSNYLVISGNNITTAHDGIIMAGSCCITGNMVYNLSGDGITGGAVARTSITGNWLRLVTGTEILTTSGDHNCCVGNWLEGGVINLAGASHTIANNET